MTQHGFSHWTAVSAEEDFRLLIHGGAWDIPEGLKSGHREGVKAAYESARDGLFRGLDTLDIVVEALKVLEDDPVFDAGTGSFLNENGEVELDAAVMEGAGLRAGAVAGVGCFANPSAIALEVLKASEHVLLVGRGAEDFARSRGIADINPRALVHPREIEAYEKWTAMGRPDAKVFFSKPETSPSSGPEPDKRGTVGIVVGKRNRDGGFDLFSGISTGGTPGKKAGRVGDVPLVGCGLYADNEGAAVSATGWGEGLIRIAAAKAVSEAVRRGAHPQEAVETTLRDMFRRTGGRGGLIAVDAEGRTGAAFTTPDMAFAGPYCRQISV